MNHRIIRITCSLLAILVVSGGLAACGSTDKPEHPSQAKQVANRQAGLKAYLPKNDVELNNYNKAQQLYDSPTTIIWCSTTWGNPSAPIVTVPIAGKLTSSSTTFFPPSKWVDRGNYSWTEVQQPSVDGLYHPNPPQYRYGFTPGGQYVDFFNMPTVCTTSLSKFQRQKTDISLQVDPEGKAATAKAEAALKAGGPNAKQKATAALAGLESDSGQ